MPGDRWGEIDRLFHAVEGLSAPDRAATLARECPDPELRAEVESLLRHHDDPLELLEQPALGARLPLARDAVLGDPAPPPLGRRVGPYRLDALLGSGGMGAVYRASRQDGLVQHTVAIKLVHQAGATGEGYERFRREWQVLAQLNHPDIARLLDAGVGDDGVPYLVMELVEGRPVDDFCDACELDVGGRLRLFARIARATHYAHQRLVVHRDLKPANVLVTGAGEPKLLDFGIARVLADGDREAGEPPAGGGAATRMMTPDYASPEQLRGEVVTTASDVYSLGVILYELLCGSRPARPTDSAPSRPSTAATGVAAPVARQRRTTPGGLQRALRGDLDNIVMMALRADPTRRYASAEQLAADVDRHLRGLPVVARPDTVLYRMRKFVRRNRVAVAAAAAGVLALAALAVVAVVQARTAADEAAHARVEARSATQMADFVVEAFLHSAPARDPEQQEAVLALVDREAETVRRRFRDEPHLRANLLDALGDVYSRLGAFDRARAVIEDGAAIRASEFGPASLESALSLSSLGRLAYRRGDHAAAVPLFERALELQRSLAAGVHTDVARAANDLAVVLRSVGRRDEAAALHAEALRLRTADHGERHPLVAESLNNLSAVAIDREDFALARQQLTSALEIRRETLGEGHPLVAQTLNNLASVVLRSGDLEGGAALMQEAVACYDALHGLADDELARSLASLAEVRRRLGETAPALALAERALALAERSLGPDHPDLALALTVLARLRHETGDAAGARDGFAAALRLRRRTLPPDHPQLATTLNDYGQVLVELGAFAEAEPLLREAVEVYDRALPAGHSFRAVADVNYGMCLLALRRFADAEVVLLRAYERLRPGGGERAEGVARLLARLYQDWGKPERARPYLPR